MLTEKGAIRTEAIFSDDKKHRYLLRKEWDTKKPKATIIMTNPSTADQFSMDYTTLYIINNLLKLDFGSVEIVNMVSKTSTKLDTKLNADSLTNEDNTTHIMKSAQKSDSVIIAWGKSGENNRKIRAIQNELLKQLTPYKEKLYIIASENGESGFHPLAPQIRFTWVLKSFKYPTENNVKEEVNSTHASQTNVVCDSKKNNTNPNEIKPKTA